MKVIGLIWIEEIVEKLEQKHNVQQREVSEVFAYQPHFLFAEKGHRAGENVYAVLGQTHAGRYLTIFFVRKSGGQALILSAQNMTQAERRIYEKK